MSLSKYLIIGSSHAGLSALDAIRVRDTDGTITLVTQEKTLPYSPTILPYVISGESNPGGISLRDEEQLGMQGINFKRNSSVVSVDSENNKVSLSTGEELHYENLLLATGASPTIPPFKGLEDVPFHVLRTLDDALKIQGILEHVDSAIVLGAGLIAMHAAENLAKAGKKVTIQVRSRVLRGYFDEQASGLVQEIFSQQGIRVVSGIGVKRVEKHQNKVHVLLESGEELSADLLLVATGVRPSIGYLAGSNIIVDEGILVDDNMLTNIENIWAAGDVAQARGFFDQGKKVDATLPSAVEQGRMAGMDMVGDPYLKLYVGGLPVNTYNFFGNRSFSIGMSTIDESDDGVDLDCKISESEKSFQKFVFRDDSLVGVAGINTDIDPGIMYQLVRKKIYIGDYRKKLFAAPRETSRIIMTNTWR